MLLLQMKEINGDRFPIYSSVSISNRTYSEKYTVGEALQPSLFMLFSFAEK